MMTPDERIDEALDRVLRASGSSLKHYTMPATLTKMRSTMREIMSENYMAGVNSSTEVKRIRRKETA
jgi:hypothetical protein